MARGSDRRVQANGLTFRCRVDGRPGTPWLVFANSLLTDLSLWDAQVAAFGDRYRTLRYDQRGHGGTDVPDGPVSFDLLVADAAALMDAMGVTDACFIGASMGAATALLLAARSPERVARVMACDGQAGTAPGGAQAWQERIDFARQRGMDALAEPTVQRWFAPASRAAGHPAIEKVREMIRSTPQDGFIACAQALQAYDFRAELPHIRQPTLLLAGAADGAMPQMMRRMGQAMSNARFAEIPEAGHLPNIEAADEVNARLACFLERF